MPKDFKRDFTGILNMLKDGSHFSVSRYGDGEFSIIAGKSIDLLTKANGEFKYQPNSDDERYREALKQSFTYQHPDYYVGIGCPCCIGQENFEKMRDESGQPESNLTWANIFVNNNYHDFQNSLLPELKNHKVVLVAHERADTTGLPFSPAKLFTVGTNAWKNDYDLIETIKSYIKINNIKDHVFLFAAGPLANILVHQLHVFSKENTYLDIGSTLDPYLGLGRHRGYLRGAKTINKICIWN